MALPTLTVCSALGRQGASVVSSFLSDPEPKYHIRALTSNVESPASKQLAAKPNVSVVAVDLNSVDSIVSAFEGSSLIFANTVFSPTVFVESGASVAQKLEASHGLNIARAASKTESLKHLIWSTLPDAARETRGEMDIPHFQSKIAAERYMQSLESGLSDKTTFLRVGLCGSVVERPPYTPIHVGAANARLLVLPISPNVPLPFAGDETFNVGLFAKTIFSQPEKTIGCYVNGTAETVSAQEWARSLEKALGRRGQDTRVVFLESTLSDFEKLWGAGGTEIGLMFEYFNKYGKESYEAIPGGRPVLSATDLGIDSLLQSNEDAAARFEW
ncbi:HSCARG dehydrogenase [Fusarium albosuccineum]|uniref:HSCARG dehydrogenase n=1 Tax=Fusarium albosuccineum TaxID=1237068 RepID=A0A8H4NX05_9HYPO|nr:HSCARG dehydrogenase [Fusarium albosuccineum]